MEALPLWQDILRWLGQSAGQPGNADCLERQGGKGFWRAGMILENDYQGLEDAICILLSRKDAFAVRISFISSDMAFRFTTSV